jgi:C4-dicarboxylate-specific signal transduction histidine kinase
MERLLRRLPIRGRILAIAGLNTGVVLLLTILVFGGAKQLNGAWDDLLQARRTDRALAAVGTEAGRLQSLIHRYFTQPSPELLAQIELTRQALAANLAQGDDAATAANVSAPDVAAIVQRVVTGFEQLRAVRRNISDLYENGVLRSAGEISGLYAILETTLRGNNGLIVPTLARSRDLFSRVVVAANGYYLTFSFNSAQDAFSGLEAIEQTLPVMRDLAETDLQRSSLDALGRRVGALRANLLKLSEAFDEQGTLLREAVDKSQDDLTAATGALSQAIRLREGAVQDRLDGALRAIYWRILSVFLGALVLIAVVGVAVARSLTRPLDRLLKSVHAIVNGQLGAQVEGRDARDELGELAQAIEVFRQNAISKAAAEEELRTSHRRLETAYAELRNAQDSLVESEKLAALGGLVAGVAHEVNNPVGISITVASALARRSAEFAADIERGELRRSKLNAFAHGSRDAAEQLVANLTRAGELIRSFKQVAVDRSQAERRTFDLLEATQQIIVSLRPSLSPDRVAIEVEGEPGVQMDSYPGPYGQVLTNLVLNAVTHAFQDGAPGRVTITLGMAGRDHAQVDVRDDGCGMDDALRRHAFEPFFTTMRGRGGTGLGLHIVQNVVTHQLGGDITLITAPRQGALFRIKLPRVAPQEGDAAAGTGGV